jgi:hypothetical protein
VDVLDTNLNVLADNIYQADGYGDLSWRRQQLWLHGAALGQPIILGFRLVADPFDPIGLGWYIDDVTLREE